VDPSQQKTPAMIVVYRVESGCLGPDGEQLVETFCSKANSRFRDIGAGVVHFLILPRRDKSQPEIQYRIMDKNVPRDKADMYLCKHEIDIEDFEEEITDRIALVIEEFFGRA
jgi:hypothetical protein